MMKNKRIVLLCLISLYLAACGTNMDPFVGMEQAEAQREYFASQLTATADSRRMGITETAAAWNFAGTQTAYPYTATALAYTPTPVPTNTPVPTATVDIQATGTASSVLLAMERDQNTNKVRSISPYFIGVLFLGLALFFGYVIARRFAMVPMQTNEQGKPLPMLNVVDGAWTDVDRSANGAGVITKKYIGLLPETTTERQDAVTRLAQLVDRDTRVARMPKRLLESQMRSLPETAASEMVGGLDAFPLPKWDALMSYPFQAGGEFPFGAFAQELARIDLNKYPHTGVTGPTGCGKSRLFLRPFIASALAAGNRVIVLGDMVDFVVFKVHPNATLVPIYQITKPEDAAQYVRALSVINKEMERRFQMLAEANLSTWERSGGENTLIVLDELGPNLDILDETNSQAARALRGFLSILFSKGRKAGFNFVFASTRAVGLKKQFSQVSTIAFRLKDTDEERFAFGQSGFGAERLPENYFLSKIGSTVRMTGSFNPSDQELGEFLMRHTTRELEKPTWIEGVFAPAEQKQVEAGQEARSLPEETLPPVNEIAQLAESIREQWSPSLSKRATARLLGFSQYGGAYADKVDRVLDYLGATTTTTAPKHPESGSFEPVAA